MHVYKVNGPFQKKAAQVCSSWHQIRTKAACTGLILPRVLICNTQPNFSEVSTRVKKNRGSGSMLQVWRTRKGGCEAGRQWFGFVESIRYFQQRQMLNKERKEYNNNNKYSSISRLFLSLVWRFFYISILPRPCLQIVRLSSSWHSSPASSSSSSSANIILVANFSLQFF